MIIELNNCWKYTGYHTVTGKRNLRKWIKWHIKLYKPVLLNVCLLFYKPFHVMINPIIFGISVFNIQLNYYDLKLALFGFEICVLLHK